jgi:hypothetical protein
VVLVDSARRRRGLCPSGLASRVGTRSSETTISILTNDTGLRAQPARSSRQLDQPAPDTPISTSLKVAGIAARALFIIALVVIVAHVSAPQTAGNIWQARASLGDLSRTIVGWGACLWMRTQLLVAPKDAHEYRSWLVLGPVLVSLLTVCAVAWW